MIRPDLSTRRWTGTPTTASTLLRAGVRVVRLDTFAHLVHADDGTTLHYDKLILATGSARSSPMTGLWADDKT